MSIQTQITATTALGIIFSAGLSVVPAQAACIVNDCAALGYTKTSSECTGEAIHCPYDATKVYCATDTCGEPFYGVTKCPDNATCTSCTVGDKTFQKNITCNKDYVFLSDKMDCISDLCPTGYARRASDCGTSGARGWTLSSYDTKPSEAGNNCYHCNMNYCSTSTYPLTNCSEGCESCWEGDTPHYACKSEYGKEMYQNKCLYVLIRNNIWQGNYPSACCFCTYGSRSDACYTYSGKSASQYPISKCNISCGTVYQSGTTYYYSY